MKRKGAVENVVHKVGFVRVTPGYPVGPQLAAIKADGVTTIYSTATDETLDDLLRHVRPGNVVVVHGLHRLAASGSDLARALRHFDEIGVKIHDVERDAWPSIAEHASVADALRIIVGEARMSAINVARARGTYRGGRKPKEGAMSVADAKSIWHYKEITNAEAVAITGWSLRKLQREFGASGRPAGWPKPKKL